MKDIKDKKDAKDMAQPIRNQTKNRPRIARIFADQDVIALRILSA